jgi:deoxycytidylate deaminase
MRPELIIGLVGPIGCDITAVERAISAALKQVDYRAMNISLSEGIAELLKEKQDEETSLQTLGKKIEAGNKVRRSYENNGILAAYAISKIREIRAQINTKAGAALPEGASFEDIRADSVAYIIRQFKRPEEIELMRKTYGRAFIQISITQQRQDRLNNLVARLGRENHGMKPDERDETARKLIRQDEDEDTDDFGQRITKIFHLADVFIDARQEDSTSTRFINALFGRNNIAPTRDEFGIGCNEVPKPLGGNYWDEDPNKKRDIDKGGEANKEETSRIVYDFLRLLSEKGALTDGYTPAKILGYTELRDAISDSMIGEITEYGRMVHAEMNAISDAARLGRAVKGATRYVTTFPCHNCAKHIISSGISRVIFIEPYPKSRTELLYGDLVSTGDNEEGKVEFTHFSGIAPTRFAEIFEKSRRRNKKTGLIEDWYQGQCRPRIGDQEIDYTSSELHAINDNFQTEAVQ